MRTAAFLMTALLLTLAGCQSTPKPQAADPQAVIDPADTSYSFQPDRYPAVHAAAVEVLRDHGFRIARDDYRFGEITTYPKESPTAVEFWVDDPTTPAQHQADTLNHQQRVVTVKVQPYVVPHFELDESLSGSRPQPPPPPPSDEERTYYELTVEVLVQRRQEPARYLTHSARGQLTSTYAAAPAHLRQRGIDRPYDQPLTRDPWFEARLIQAIRAAAGE